MRVAVLIAGRITGWQYNFLQTRSMLANSFSDVDFYCSIHGEEREDDVQKFLSVLQPKACNVQVFADGTETWTPSYRFKSMLYHNYRGVQLIQQSGITYDWVIKSRADMILTQPLVLPSPLPTEDTVYCPTNARHYGTPFPHDWCPDQWGMGSMRTMHTYSHAYLEYGRIQHTVPEVMLCRHLHNHGISVKLFQQEYDIEPRRHEVVM